MIYPREPLPQSVARKLQGMILSGELKPGARIPSQRELSEKFGVSRASLREGLLTLETLGLVYTAPGRGTFVSQEKPSSGRELSKWRYAGSHTVADVFQTRLMLEGRIAALAAARISPADIGRLDASADRMERTFAEGDLLSNVEADLEFHGLIAAACPNRMLVDLYQSVLSELTETQRQPIPKTAPERMAQSVGEHRAIVAALKAGDGAAAGAAMESHIRNTAGCAGVAI